MTITAKMDDSINRWNLLESKFYQAWSAGTLPLSALRTYAREYGAFVAAIPAGWARHGDTRTAAVETEHVELWRMFADGLETEISEPETPAVRALVDQARALFSDAETSLGALYAFEVQQPKTSRSKLTGLDEHYDVPDRAKQYFRVHLDDEDEVRLLADRIAALGVDGRRRAEEACEQLARSLREALDGLYEDDCGC